MPQKQITVKFNPDILDRLKRLAQKQGKPFNAVVNDVCSNATNDDLSSIREAIARIEKKLGK